MGSAWHVGHKRQDCLTFSTSVHKFKQHSKFTAQNLTSQTAPRAARSEEIPLRQQKVPSVRSNPILTLVSAARSPSRATEEALLSFISSLRAPAASALAGHTHLLCKQVNGAQGTARTPSLAQNGLKEDLHFPALNAKGRFCPDKNDSGSISWESTAGQGEKPAHPKCY